MKELFTLYYHRRILFTDFFSQSQKCVSSPLQRVHMVCIDENGQYTSTDSFKYCSRVIHKELLLAFDYHSLRHTPPHY